MDIIITGQQAWDIEIGSNCKNIALELSKNHRVLYVNAPLDRITMFRGGSDPKVAKRRAVIEGRQNGLEKIQDNLWTYYPDCMIESINWIGFHTIFKFLNKRNNRLFAGTIEKAISQLNFDKYIHFNDNDMFRSFHLKELLKPESSIYYSRDYMLAVDYWKKHGAVMEPALIAKSDLCVANSTYLADYCRRYNPKSYYVGQGCDTDIFMAGRGSAVPGDIASIQGPKIGYVGALQSMRLDLEILEYVAVSRPEWTIVLVGPEDSVFAGSKLHHFANVVFTGSKDFSELPAYINAFDVCLNPQILNEVTIGNYPRKIDEYLAVGKPVVATETDAMSVFAEHVYLGKTKEDYVRLIERALTENTLSREDERRAVASTHTWENSVAHILNAVSLSQ